MGRLLPVLSALSMVVAGLALAMVVPLLVSLLYGDAARSAYAKAVPITLGAGASLWLLEIGRAHV